MSKKINGYESKHRRLREELKRSMYRFGVGLEKTVHTIVDIYNDSRGSVSDIDVQEIAYMVRAFVDDRGCDYESHVHGIETYLVDFIYHDPFTFPEPLLVKEDQSPKNKIYMHSIPQTEDEKKLREKLHQIQSTCINYEKQVRLIAQKYQNMFIEELIREGLIVSF